MTITPGLYMDRAGNIHRVVEADDGMKATGNWWRDQTKTQLCWTRDGNYGRGESPSIHDLTQRVGDLPEVPKITVTRSGYYLTRCGYIARITTHDDPDMPWQYVYGVDLYSKNGELEIGVVHYGDLVAFVRGSQ